MQATILVAEHDETADPLAFFQAAILAGGVLPRVGAAHDGTGAWSDKAIASPGGAAQRGFVSRALQASDGDAGAKARRRRWSEAGILRVRQQSCDGMEAPMVLMFDEVLPGGWQLEDDVVTSK